MFRSVFKNLLVTYLLIVILAITALSLAISVVYRNYIFSSKRQMLENAAYKVNQMAYRYERDIISMDELQSSIDSIGFITDSKIYFIELSKDMLSSNRPIDLGDGFKENYLTEALRTILSGRPVFYQRQYTDKFDMYMIFSGIPYKSGSTIKGAILMFSPESNINADISRMNAFIWIIALLFVIISTIVVYFSSRRISMPLLKIRSAAMLLASGEKAEDIPVYGNDEVGELAKTFNFMKSKLLDTEKMRREFIANVSHDLRTPLTSISGFVEGMLDGVAKPAQYSKYLSIIKSETNRLMRLTSDILEVAKLQSGSVPLKIERFHIDPLVLEVIENMKGIADPKKITVLYKGSTEFSVEADPDKLRQVLVNIIGNAIHHSPADSEVNITVKIEAEQYEFEISDKGTGIPAEDLPYIFEKFYRVDKSRQSSDHPTGTGLGLNIAKSLVEMHKGRIWAESEKGRGTSVKFRIHVFLHPVNN